MHSLTTVGLVWSVLSFIVAVLCCTGFYMPYWLEGEIQNITVHLGVFRRCNFLVKDQFSVTNKQSVREECTRYKRFDDIPSTAWKGSTIALGVACGILVLTSFISLLAICFRDVITKRMARVCGAFQALAAVFLVGACVIFPLGWDSSEVRQACGKMAKGYELGNCSVGWSAILTGIGSVLAFVCSCLSINAAKSDRMRASTYDAKYDTM